MEREDYFFEAGVSGSQNKIYVLIIYDIIENKKRIKLAKYLLGYGNRVQKSSFEAYLSQVKYEKLLREIPSFCGEEDSIRVYKIIGKGQVLSWGYQVAPEPEDIIVI